MCIIWFDVSSERFHFCFETSTLDFGLAGQRFEAAQRAERTVLAAVEKQREYGFTSCTRIVHYNPGTNGKDWGGNPPPILGAAMPKVN